MIKLVKLIPEIKIVPNFRQPKEGDFYFDTINKEKVKIEKVNDDEVNLIQYNTYDNEYAYYDLTYNEFMEEVRKGHLEFING